MSDILFSHSYYYRFDPKQWKAQKPYPPLGTIYAASVMREAGFSVSLFDVAFVERPEEILPIMDTEKPRYLVIYDDGFNYLTKMCLTNMRHAAWKMGKMAQERGIKVIVCSSDSTDHYEKYLENGADFIIKGEGELTLKELIETLESGSTDYDSVQGLSYRKEGEPVNTPKRRVNRDLDSLPPPAWDLIDIAPYKAAWANHGHFSLNLATTRGCPYKCNWCAKPIYGNRYNSRSPEQVVDEIAFLLDRFQPDHFWMCDDIFGLKPGWVQRFNELVQERNLSFSYMIQSRVDLLLQDDTIDALSKSGCDTVWLGAESGSQKILDAMDKGTKVEQIYEARRKLKKHGVKVAFFLQFGYLGETQEDIDLTFKMLGDLLPDDIGVSVAYPLPGTKFYDMVKDDLADKANWTDSDELALMFRNTYSPSYYKRLHRFVHKDYRKKQAFEALRNLFDGHPGRFRKALSSLYYVPSAFVEKQKLNALRDV